MRNKVDQINDAFIKILTEEKAKPYAEYIKSINTEIIENLGNLSKSKIKSIVQGAKINIDDIVLMFMIQNALLQIIDKRIPKSKRDPSIIPIVAIIGMYSIKRPDRFARKVLRIVQGKGLSEREKKAQTIIQGFKQDNAAILEDARKIARNRLDTSILKSNVSKRMQKDLRIMVKEKQSIKSIKRNLIRKYNSLSNVERALDTELHAQSEEVRKVHSKALGYTHKTWNTQNDSRVRDTHFHDGVANKRVPIDSDFRAGGLKAQQPGDTGLPPSDRIRCRCYLTYD